MYVAVEKGAALFVIILGLFAITAAVDNLTGSATVHVANLTAGVDTFLSCTWSSSSLNISFGTNLNPGISFYNATNNYGANNATKYNVTIDSLSNVEANISIKGADFVSGNHNISIGNVTWQSNTTSANGSNMVHGKGIVLSNDYNTNAPVGSALAPGSVVYFRMWMSVPYGQVAGSYSGNYTMQCVQS